MIGDLVLEMAGALKGTVERYLHKKLQRRWGVLAEEAALVDLETLRGLRSRARSLRRQLDRVIHEAEHRLALPVIGSNAIRKPLGTDWSWRPDLWRVPLRRIVP